MKKHFHPWAFIASVLVCLALLVYLYQSYDRVKEQSLDEGTGWAKILFIGDMMFDRTIRTIAEKQSYEHLFSCVEEYLGSFDIVVGNLEGPITKENSVSKDTVPGEPGNTSFTFAYAVARELASHNIRLVNLGNNHIRDFGEAGLTETKAALDKEHVDYFGDPTSNLAKELKIGGEKIAFINFNQFIENDPDSTIEEIRTVRASSQRVIVYAHWGEEYSKENEYQKNLAHRFVDAGADLIIGTHPHILQGHETYKGAEIFYSLGNFIFDQYWNDSVRRGGGVEAVFSADGIETTEVFFDISRDGTVCRA
jgi:poly-gamma-glutamate capsule biosynthesis protein CapA/YwtB (metallophosphatase superfamily)